MSPLLAVGLLLSAGLGCAAHPGAIDEPDAADLDVLVGPDVTQLDDAMPPDSALHTPSSDVSAASCGCSFARDSERSALALLGLLALVATRRRRVFLLVRSCQREHDERVVDEPS
jgi:MYXO-CTERM domain-containing protein